ncbi:hypothetical protein ACOBR2_12025 [Telmatobacter bradus]|uniref:hypothetical protein n=1 Tax=Telmatobacter bradus TaxID=474953 RepID=UPI003B42C6A3
MLSKIFLLLLLLSTPLLLLAASKKKCYSADEATKKLHKEVCISAHIYDVVETQDGTRFLDVCAPEVPDALCHFTIISFVEDSVDVGDLWRYLNNDVQIRGMVQPMHGRAGIVLSHARQFDGGPPKFRPNPVLAYGFDAEQQKPPIEDPNLRRQGGARGFMNNSSRVTK